MSLLLHNMKTLSSLSAVRVGAEKFEITSRFLGTQASASDTVLEASAVAAGKYQHIKQIIESVLSECEATDKRAAKLSIDDFLLYVLSNHPEAENSTNAELFQTSEVIQRCWNTLRVGPSCCSLAISALCRRNKAPFEIIKHH